MTEIDLTGDTVTGAVISEVALERSNDGITFKRVATVSSAASSYRDRGLMPGSRRMIHNPNEPPPPPPGDSVGENETGARLITGHTRGYIGS